LPAKNAPIAPWQGRFLKERSREAIVIGGIASGKSFIAADWLITECICRFPQSQSGIVLGTHKQAKEGALKTFTQRCTFWFGPEGVGWKQNKTDLSVTFLRGPARGHRVSIWSAEAYETMKSVELDFIWCDELQTWQHGSAALDFVRGRNRYSPIALATYGDYDDDGVLVSMPFEVKLRMSANPPWTTAHWLYQQFVERNDVDLDGNDVPLYHVRTADNTLLPDREGYIANLRSRMAPDVFRIEVLGEWGDIGRGRIYTSFYRGRATSPSPLLPFVERVAGTDRIKRDPPKPLYWTQDFGVNPRVSLVIQIHQQRIPIVGYQRVLLYVLDEIEIPSGSTDLMIKEFVRRYPASFDCVDANGQKQRIDRQRVYVYGDHRGGDTRNSTTAETDWGMMRNAKELRPYDISYHYRASNPPIVDRYAVTNAKLCNADDEIGILIHPRCKKLLADLQQTAYKAGTRIADKGTPSRGIFRTHLSDALGYLIEHESEKLGVNFLRRGARTINVGIGRR
jgi:hypothetical protein